MVTPLRAERCSWLGAELEIWSGQIAQHPATAFSPAASPAPLLLLRPAGRQFWSGGLHLCAGAARFLSTVLIFVFSWNL
jgi:hypothetical protein